MAYCRTGEKPKSDVYCIQHINGEYCTMIASYIFVKNPIYTEHMLNDKSVYIEQWLSKHYGCELILGWRDDHLDKLWEEGYTIHDLHKELKNK